MEISKLHQFRELLKAKEAKDLLESLGVDTAGSQLEADYLSAVKSVESLMPKAEVKEDPKDDTK